VNHVAGSGTKGQALKGIVRAEFKKNVSIDDPAKIELLKGGAVRGLASYLMMESSSQVAHTPRHIPTHTHTCTCLFLCLRPPDWIHHRRPHPPISRHAPPPVM